MPNQLIEHIKNDEFAAAEALINTLSGAALINTPDEEDGALPIHLVTDFSAYEDLSDEVRAALNKLAILLIKAGAKLDVAHVGLFPMHYVCDRHNGSLEVLQAILDTGFDYNKQDVAGETALHHAIKGGESHRKIVDYLLTKPSLKMLKTIEDLGSQTPLDYARLYYHEIVNLLSPQAILCKFLCAVHDAATLDVFKVNLAQVDNAELKPEATSTAKAVLNVALEQIVVPLLANTELSYEAARFKLTAMDLLLCRGALKTANTETQQSLNELNRKAAFLYTKLSAEKINQAPFSSLSSAEQKFLTVFYWIKASFDILKRIQVLRQVVQTLKQKAKTVHRPIIICETHNDNGSLKFLTGLKEYLAAGYSILIEEAYNLPPKQIVEIWSGIFQHDEERINRSNIITFATQGAFANTTRFIDQLLDPTPDVAAMNLHAFVQTKMFRMTSMALRDEGMYLEVLRSIYQGTRVVGVFGAMHGEAIVRKLKNDNGIDSIAVMPFSDHTKMRLVKSEDGNFSAEPGFYFLHALLTELGADALNLSSADPQVFQDFLIRHKLVSAPEPVLAETVKQFSGMKLTDS